jgi:large subunit ribosomal protein L13
LGLALLKTPIVYGARVATERLKLTKTDRRKTMKTYMAKSTDVVRKWYLVDAEGATLGRLASKVAAILRGKNKPTFTPNVDTGDFVIVINTDKVVLTGKKLEKKYYRYHTGHIGGLKEIQYKTLMENKSDLAVYEAIKGMLPKNSLGRKMITKLKVYKGAEHNHQAQKPEILKLV